MRVLCWYRREAGGDVITDSMIIESESHRTLHQDFKNAVDNHNAEWQRQMDLYMKSTRNYAPRAMRINNARLVSYLPHSGVALYEDKAPRFAQAV